MIQDTSVPAGLLEVRELNRCFLEFLRGRAAEHTESLGLPESAVPALAAAPDALIERLAGHPQALFRFDLARIDDGMVQDGSPHAGDGQLPALQLMLLVSARYLCRQAPGAARLYLRLSPDKARRLAELPIDELPRLSRVRGIVSCAFAGKPWMWCELLQSSRPDRVRALILLGLQPPTEINGVGILNR